MNVARAREIAKSGEVVPVTYNGTRVLIQHVDGASETARIYPAHAPEQEQTVPVSSLMEQ